MVDGIGEIVRRVVNREDIEGLLSLGAPPDEYDREAELVARAVRQMLLQAPGLHLSTDQVVGALQDVWSRTFGPYSEADLARRDRAFRRAATEIIRALGGVGKR
jgi:hypothetical protein